MTQAEYQALNQLKTLALDQIYHADLPYYGERLSSAEIFFALYAHQFMAHKLRPHWFNRDRLFVCDSKCSAIYYALLAEYGFIDVTNLRGYATSLPIWLNPQTDGVDYFSDVEGIMATAVGSAIAEKYINARYGSKEHAIVDHYTYVYMSIDELKSEKTQNAMLYAQKLNLGKLIVLCNCYNQTTTEAANMSNLSGWQVISISNGNDVEEIERAIAKAKQIHQPTLILCPTKDNSELELDKYEGQKLDKYAIIRLKKRWQLIADMFSITPSVQSTIYQLEKDKLDQIQLFEVHLNLSNKPTQEVLDIIASLENKKQHLICARNIREISSTREAVGRHINQYLMQYDDSMVVNLHPDFVCQSLPNIDAFTGGNAFGNLIMPSDLSLALHLANGIALHGGLVAIMPCSLNQLPDMITALKITNLLNLPVKLMIDEDCSNDCSGVTNMVEMIDFLRCLPSLIVCRPCDGVELAICTEKSFASNNPSAILFNNKVNPPITKDMTKLVFGAQILQPQEKGVDGVLYATGEEVRSCISARKKLLKLGFQFIVVSLPCVNFLSQSKSVYQSKILMPDVPIHIVVERSSGISLSRFVNGDGAVLSANTNATHTISVNDIVNIAIEKLVQIGKLKENIFPD